MTVYAPPGTPTSPVSFQSRYGNFIGGEWGPSTSYPGAVPGSRWRHRRASGS